MRGAVVTAPRRVELQDLPIPTPGPDEALELIGKRDPGVVKIVLKP